MIFLSCSRKTVELSRVSGQNTSVLYSGNAAPKIDSIIKPYKDSIDRTMHAVLCYSSTDLYKAQPEGTLGNLVADAVLHAAKAKDSTVNISLVNYGGVRLPFVSAGPITLEKVYEIQPFENEIVLIDLRGPEVASLLDAVAAKGGWPVAGVTFLISDNKAVNIVIGKTPFDIRLKYKLALSDYVANGGDNMSMLKNIAQEKIGVKMRDALIEYLQTIGTANDSLRLEPEDRIQAEE